MWSSYIQLKLNHDHFKSYLKKLSDHDSDKCDCNNSSSQSSAHLLLSCNKYATERKIMRDKLQIGNLSLKILLNTKLEIQTVFEFLDKTKIARKIQSED